MPVDGRIRIRTNRAGSGSGRPKNIRIRRDQQTSGKDIIVFDNNFRTGAMLPVRQVDEEVLDWRAHQDGARGGGAAHTPLQHLRQGRVSNKKPTQKNPPKKNPPKKTTKKNPPKKTT